MHMDIDDIGVQGSQRKVTPCRSSKRIYLLIFSGKNPQHIQSSKYLLILQLQVAVYPMKKARPLFRVIGMDYRLNAFTKLYSASHRICMLKNRKILNMNINQDSKTILIVDHIIRQTVCVKERLKSI